MGLGDAEEVTRWSSPTRWVGFVRTVGAAIQTYTKQNQIVFVHELLRRSLKVMTFSLQHHFYSFFCSHEIVEEFGWINLAKYIYDDFEVASQFNKHHT